jgi:hypothetical protein
MAQMANLPDHPAAQPTQPTVRATLEGVAQPVAGQQTQSTTPHERHPYPCQRAYGTFRRHILKFLTKPGRSRLFDGIQRTVMAGFLLLDMPVRWLMDLFDAISSNRGYLAVGSVRAGARERIHRLMGGFGDPRIAVAPQERVADADVNPSEIAGASSRDKADRIDAGGVQRGKAICGVADATRQQARRVEG